MDKDTPKPKTVEELRAKHTITWSDLNFLGKNCDWVKVWNAVWRRK